MQTLEASYAGFCPRQDRGDEHLTCPCSRAPVGCESHRVGLWRDSSYLSRASGFSTLVQTELIVSTGMNEAVGALGWMGSAAEVRSSTVVDNEVTTWFSAFVDEVHEG